MNAFEYIGDELDLFAHATNWKRYWSSIVRPYVGARVLDVGAGLGATAKVLANASVDNWCCLEPDRDLANRLQKAIADGELPRNCEVVCGVLGDLAGVTAFDSILYIDVLEHIENDKQQLHSATGLLAQGGYLVVLAPAHNWLFSKFDERIGHFRRYNKRLLLELSPPECELVSINYLDSAGVTLSLVNSLILRRSMPTAANIGIWDKIVVPLSRAIDPLLGFTIGKTVVAVWRKKAGG